MADIRQMRKTGALLLTAAVLLSVILPVLRPVDCFAEEGTQEVYRAYLNLLQSNQSSIESYYPSIRNISFYNVWGDSNPEMIYSAFGLGKSINNDVTRSLVIVSYQSGSIRTLYTQEEWDIFAGGGYENCLFMINGGKALGAYSAALNQASAYTYRILKTDTGSGFSVAEEFCEIEHYVSQDDSVYSEYTLNDSAVSEAEFAAKRDALRSAADQVILGEYAGSFGHDDFISESRINNCPSMTYAQAVAYLQKLLQTQSTTQKAYSCEPFKKYVGKYADAPGGEYDGLLFIDVQSVAKDYVEINMGAVRFGEFSCRGVPVSDNKLHFDTEDGNFAGTLTFSADRLEIVLEKCQDIYYASAFRTFTIGQKYTLYRANDTGSTPQPDVTASAVPSGAPETDPAYASAGYSESGGTFASDSVARSDDGANGNPDAPHRLSALHIVLIAIPAVLVIGAAVLLLRGKRG